MKALGHLRSDLRGGGRSNFGRPAAMPQGSAGPDLCVPAFRRVCPFGVDTTVTLRRQDRSPGSAYSNLRPQLQFLEGCCDQCDFVSAIVPRASLPIRDLQQFWNAYSLGRDCSRTPQQAPRRRDRFDQRARLAAASVHEDPAGRGVTVSASGSRAPTDRSACEAVSARARPFAVEDCRSQATREHRPIARHLRHRSRSEGPSIWRGQL